MTNYEKFINNAPKEGELRNLSLEEVAKILWAYVKRIGHLLPLDKPLDEWIKWLEQEAEE